jgi:hypothetical protein
MEALADCAVGVRNPELECLRNIISMHMMHGFHAEIGKKQFLAGRELREHREIEVSGRVEWMPAGPDDVAGMENRRAYFFAVRRLKQPFFDRRFFYSVVAKWLARLRLGSWNDSAVSVNPDGSAMQEQRIAFLQRLNQMLRTLQCEANQIDDDVRTESCNAVSESAGGFLR